jgi:hypothetical protein
LALRTTFDLFQCAERIETLAAAVYGALAGQFRGDREAQALFRALEAEELQHASRVRLLAASYRNDSKVVDRVNGAEELDGCLAAAERALAEVRGGGWGPGLADVLSRVSRLEVRLASAHANLLARNGNGALREFLEQLARMDAAHLHLLR